MNNKKWEIQKKFKVKNSEFRIDEIVTILLENRGITTKKQREEFFNPSLDVITSQTVGLNSQQLKKALERIKKAIKNKETIVIYGDYDVDGITATAILWETLYGLGANVLPYIPSRFEEGYGLSIQGIDNINQPADGPISNVQLIITVDNGIVANKAVDYANSLGIDVIITDHHVPNEEEAKKPSALAIVHTTTLCGAGIAYLLAQEIKKSDVQKIAEQVQDDINNEHLALAALGTVADLMPLTGANRAIVKHGIVQLRQTVRPGLLALFKQAGIDSRVITTYEIGHIIAPRLNASGRLELAMDSLRLLCTKSRIKAYDLAEKLGVTNKERQQLTKESFLHAKMQVVAKEEVGNLLFVAHESYNQGIIGLIAGRLVDEYYRPAIVLSVGEIHSKASARSVKGFNIIEFIRNASEHLTDAGGHPMAAGFSVETAKLGTLQKILEEMAEKQVTKEHVTRKLRVDTIVPLSLVNEELLVALEQLAPFGMGNPEPVFVTEAAVVEDKRLVGAERQHLKLYVFQNNSVVVEAIGFGMGDMGNSIKIGESLNIAYSLSLNEWNGNKSLQLKLKDIKINS